MNHAAFVIPLSRHYLNRLRNLLTRLKHHHQIHLTKEAILDLKLWLRFLRLAHDGVSINLIIERRPDSLFVTDSCECGLGGFSVKTGRAFRFEIPPHLRFKVSNNVLEYLAEVVAIWLGVLEGEVTEESCVFAGTDNTSAVGWTHKSNFSDATQEPHIEISRKLASLSIDHRFCLYSQHFTGWMNVVADSLSRDSHLPDEFLAHLLFHFYPSQLPASFQIYPLPPVIISFIIGILEASPGQTLAYPKRQRSTIGAGLVGVPLPKTSNLDQIHSWIQSNVDIEPSSSASLPANLEKESLASRMCKVWQRVQCQRPVTKWQRASGLTFGQTPATMSSDESTLFAVYK